MGIASKLSQHILDFVHMLCVLHCWAFMVIYILPETLAAIFLSHSSFLKFTSNYGSTFGLVGLQKPSDWVHADLTDKAFGWEENAWTRHGRARKLSFWTISHLGRRCARQWRRVVLRRKGKRSSCRRWSYQVGLRVHSCLEMLGL